MGLMSLRIPAFARAAFGDVGLPPITCIEQAILQNCLFLHFSTKNFFPQAGLPHIISTRATLMSPLKGLCFPVKPKEIFFFVCKLGKSLCLLETFALQLVEQYFFGSLGKTSNKLAQFGRKHLRISRL